MDPLSRRRVWAAIEKLKKGRVIVMTTHNMEEADALGDKVAILSRGSLRAVGSSLFLKRRFGAGYVQFHFIYRYILNEFCSRFDLPPSYIII